MIVQSGHHSVIEHVSVAVKFVVDRGVSHELVRHRICSFSQESTRFCNYGRKGVTFVIPPWVNLEPGLWEGIPTTIGDGIDSVTDRAWLESMSWAEEHYNFLLAQGWKPEQARAVLPNSLKTEIVCTANLREWKHIFQERTTPRAHPQMREVMVPLRDELTEKLPLIFA
jgi:thymidylate synthase (FAD)